MVALVDGFHLLDFDTGALTFLVGPEQVPGTRFNDGKVSPDGRFWAGTMDEEQLSRPIAALYRLDPDGSLHRGGRRPDRLQRAGAGAPTGARCSTPTARAR